MSNGTPAQVAEQLAATLEDLIVAVGRGIGQAQTELDRSSIAMQKAIDTDPILSQHGLQATWYQMPRTELEIKVALAFQKVEGVQPPPSLPGPRLPELPLLPPKVWIQPVNARYQNQFNYDASATSTLRMTIVPVPPQVTDAQQAPPKLTEEKVKTAATPLLEKEPGGTELRKDARVVANFSSAARVWYVLQFTEVQGQTTTLAVVEVSDETGKAVRR